VVVCTGGNDRVRLRRHGLDDGPAVLPSLKAVMCLLGGCPGAVVCRYAPGSRSSISAPIRIPSSSARLVTQMDFEGDPLNEKDRILQRVGGSASRRQGLSHGETHAADEGGGGRLAGRGLGHRAPARVNRHPHPGPLRASEGERRGEGRLAPRVATSSGRRRWAGGSWWSPAPRGGRSSRSRRTPGCVRGPWRMCRTWTPARPGSPRPACR